MQQICSLQGTSNCMLCTVQWPAKRIYQAVHQRSMARPEHKHADCMKLVMEVPRALPEWHISPAHFQTLAYSRVPFVMDRLLAARLTLDCRTPSCLAGSKAHTAKPWLACSLTCADAEPGKHLQREGDPLQVQIQQAWRPVHATLHLHIAWGAWARGPPPAGFLKLRAQCCLHCGSSRSGAMLAAYSCEVTEHGGPEDSGVRVEPSQVQCLCACPPAAAGNSRLLGPGWHVHDWKLKGPWP